MTNPECRVDGPALYVYVRGSPITLNDPSGTQSTTTPPKLERQPNGLVDPWAGRDISKQTPEFKLPSELIDPWAHRGDRSAEKAQEPLTMVFHVMSGGRSSEKTFAANSKELAAAIGAKRWSFDEQSAQPGVTTIPVAKGSDKKQSILGPLRLLSERTGQ